jgi:N6-adenosine-specific RNA methylase IME4
MSYDEIVALPVARLAAEDASLFLWVTQDALHTGAVRAVMDSWGFPHRSGELIWRKPNFGTGALPRIGHETCVIYRRGRGSLKAAAPRNVHSVQTWAQLYGRGNGGKQHSAKPDAFFDLVTDGFDGPYAELFARRARFGWEYPIGDQALGGIAA